MTDFPLVEVAIEPTSQADQEPLIKSLVVLAHEDPSFTMSIDRESGQIILKGTSEDHLDSNIDVLRSRHNIDIRVGAPQVAFRERVTQSAEAEYVHKKQSGSVGQFAIVRLRVEPNAPGKGYSFASRMTDDAMPRAYVNAVEQGVANVLPSGVVAGFPVVDIKVTLIDGKFHDVDSTAKAFEAAGRAAFRNALQQAGPVLLEPVMKVEVVAPEIFAAPLLADLNVRRGQIEGQDTRGAAIVIRAMVPLMNMFGYTNDLRSIGQGRASFTMQFDHYAPAPPQHPQNDPPFRPAIGMRA